jgi:methylmalonyl-CoA mutase N-terminal domain/subunit
LDKKKRARLQDQKDQWESGTLHQALEKSGERDMFSELPKERLYTPLDLEDFDYMENLGFPGDYPFTRGIHPTMHRGRLWGMAEYAGFGMPEDTNREISPR